MIDSSIMLVYSDFKARSSSVHQIYSEFLDSRTRYIELLDRYNYHFQLFLSLFWIVMVYPRSILLSESWWKKNSDCVSSNFRFKQMLPLLAKVPVLPCLFTRQLFQDRQQGVFSLLDWISAQVSQSFCHNLSPDSDYWQTIPGEGALKFEKVRDACCSLSFIKYGFWSKCPSWCLGLNPRYPLGLYLKK